MLDHEVTEINLRALKRHDATVENIVECANQVALYKFKESDGEWKKLDVEGSLFIFTRSKCDGRSKFAFTIINRINTTNIFQDITTSLDLTLENPYLLYKNSSNEIFCIWFYEPTACWDCWIKLKQLISISDIQLN